MSQHKLRPAQHACAPCLPTARHILCTERNVWSGTNNSYDGVTSKDGFTDNKHKFIHSVGCLTTGPQPLPQRLLHRVRSNASSFTFQYPLFSLRLSSGCLHLLPRLIVIRILPSIVAAYAFFSSSRHVILPSTSENVTGKKKKSA
jgi:hypothetical protein